MSEWGHSAFLAEVTGVTVTPISRPFVKGAEHFFWQL